MQFQFTDGDQGFVGIDSTRERDALEPGLLARGENTRLRTRRARQREGTLMPGDFNPAGGFGNFLIGSGVFNDPNGNELLMLAPANTQYVWAAQWSKDPFKVNYDATEIASGRTNGIGQVAFAQSFDQLSLLRRPTQGGTNLIWDGVKGHNFSAIALSANGFKIVPPRYNAEPFQNRLIYYNGNTPDVGDRDTWLVSDIEDYTSYDDVYQTIRTNTAESDFITRIFGYFRGSVIVFKSESIHQVFFQPTYPFTVSSRRVSGDLGSYGTNMPVMIGGDVIFYSPPNGFYRLSQVDQENTFSLPVSISDQIQDTIDNINVPTTVIFGCSAVLDRYAFFGVSIGVGATALNAVLVFNTQTNQWESAPDTWRDPAFGFNALHVVNYQGVKRLFAIDYANGAVYLMYEGINDELVSGSWTVPFKLETRGYNAQDQVSWKRFFRTKLAISTYAPSITLTAINEGFNEEKLLTPTPIEKSRLKFYTEGHADYNPLTDDATEPKRKDYSLIDFSELAIEDFEELPDGPLSVLPGTPTVTPGDKQQSLERYTVNTNGRWCSLRIENDQGSCDLLSVTMEGNAIQDTRRTAA